MSTASSRSLRTRVTRRRLAGHTGSCCSTSWTSRRRPTSWSRSAARSTRPRCGRPIATASSRGRPSDAGRGRPRPVSTAAAPQGCGTASSLAVRTSSLVPWVSPQPRAVLLPHQITVPRSLRQQIRRHQWQTTVDAAFAEVMARCADQAGRDLDHDGDAGRPTSRCTTRAAPTASRSGTATSSSAASTGCCRVGSSPASPCSSPRAVRRRPQSSTCAAGWSRPGSRCSTPSRSPSTCMAMGQVLVDRDDYVAAVRQLQQPATLPDDRRSAGLSARPAPAPRSSALPAETRLTSTSPPPAKPRGTRRSASPSSLSMPTLRSRPGTSTRPSV